MHSRHSAVVLRPPAQRLFLRAGLSPLALLLALGGAALAQNALPPGRIPAEAPGRAASEPPARTVSEAPARTVSEPPAGVSSEAPARTASEAPARTNSEASARSTSEPPARAPKLESLSAATPVTPSVQAIVPGAGAGTPTEPAPAKKSRELPPLVVARVSADPLPTLSPATFLDTLRMADRYQALADAGGWVALPADLVVKPGASHPAIPGLRKHLIQVGDLAPDAAAGDQLDAPLVAAVKSFQARHGLPETGLIGRQTVAALNVPAATRQRQLSASATRQLGSNFAYGDRYVVVNIPSATVEAVEHGVVVRRYVAVVGKPDKATPRIEARITDVNLNPTWTLPVSIIKKEIIPKMRKDPGYLARERIRILGPGGTEVDPTAIDWSSEKAANYTLRQDSGLDNSLGQVRIDMPNKQAVYMHDTPSKSLFAREVRFHSHGCVRVAQVKELAGWLLEGTPGPNGPGSTWGPIEIETSIATNERLDIKLPKQIPVTFVYLTGYATPDGRAHFRDDIYGIDSPAVRMPEVAATGTIVPKAPVGQDLVKPTAVKPSVTKPSATKPSAIKPTLADSGAPPQARSTPKPEKNLGGAPIPPGLIPNKAARPTMN